MRPVDLGRLLALAAIWGASFLFLRIVVPVLGPLPSAFFRVFFGLLGLLAILLAARLRPSFQGRLGACMVLGLINSALPFCLYAIAAQWLPAGYSAVFNAMTPLMVVLVGSLAFAETLTLGKGLGVLCGLLGVSALTVTGPLGLNGQSLAGALACLLATLCYALSGYLARRWVTDRGGLDSRLVAFGSMLGATLGMLPAFAASLLWQAPTSWGDLTTWLSLVTLGLVCTAFAYTLYFRLLADIGPLKVTTVTFLIPPFGILWGALLLGEPVGWAYLYGGALIALALWLVLAPARR